MQIFADDTKIYREMKDQSDIKQLQDDIDSLSEERQIELEETTVEKDLCIWVDNELGFKEHINKVVNKANST